VTALGNHRYHGLQSHVLVIVPECTIINWINHKKTPHLWTSDGKPRHRGPPMTGDPHVFSHQTCRNDCIGNNGCTNPIEFPTDKKERAEGLKCMHATGTTLSSTTFASLPLCTIPCLGRALDAFRDRHSFFTLCTTLSAGSYH
jgi:hypothetical protein